MLIKSKSILWAACAATSINLLGTMLSPALAQEKKTSDSIVLGVIEDRSGTASFFSQEAVKAVKVFVESINKGELGYAGPVVGNTPGILGKPVQVLYEDDENNPNVTIVKSRRLVERGANVLLFLSGSGATAQGRVVCSEQKILCIAPTNTNSRLVQAPNDDYIFTVAPQNELGATAYINAWKKLGFKKVAVISDTSGTSRAVADSYRKTWEIAGFTTVADEQVEIGSSDVNSPVLRMKEQKPDVVFDAISSPTEQAALYKSLARFGVPAQRWANSGLSVTPKIWELAGDTVNGTLVVDPSGPSNPNTAQIKKVYTARYGADTFIWVQAAVWDGLMLIKTAANAAKSTDGTKLRDAVESVSNFPSALGQAGNTLSFAKGKHNGASEKMLVVIQFANQKPSVLWSVYQPSK